MDTKHNYETTDVALARLKEMGYGIAVNVEFNEILADAESYQIDYLYRYDGPSNPADESTVYGTSNVDNGKTGVSVAGHFLWIEDKKRYIISAMESKYKTERHA